MHTPCMGAPVPTVRAKQTVFRSFETPLYWLITSLGLVYNNNYNNINNNYIWVEVNTQIYTHTPTHTYMHIIIFM